MSGIGSTVFELVRTVEVDLEIEEDSWPVRIELFRDRDDDETYRAHVWLLETFRIQPLYPMDEEGEPQEAPADEDLLIEWNRNLDADLDAFTAASDEEALAIVLASLDDFATQAAGNGHTDA